MKGIAIVSTPMQLINCVELMYKKNFDVSVLILLYTNHRRCESMKDILKIQEIKAHFDTVKYINLGTGIRSLGFNIYLRFLLSSLSGLDTYDICVIGNHFLIQSRYLILKITNKSPNCNFYICDDGLATLNSYRCRLAQIREGKNVFPCSQRARKVAFMFSGINNFIPRSLCFFTVYSLEKNAVDSYIYNTYDYIRSHLYLFNSSVDFNSYDTIFIGQPLYQKGILDMTTFNKCLKYVIERSLRGKILYILHPQEDINSLQLNEDLKDCVDAFSFDYPIETLLSALENKSIYSFYTSALVNLKYMNLCSNFYALWLKDVLEMNNNYSRALKRVYQYLSANGIQVIKDIC